MPLAQRFVAGMFAQFDKAKTGFIEFEEFERYVLYETFD